MHSEKKNDVVTLQIRDLGSHGEGIGRTDSGYTLFVPGTIPGDQADVQILKAGKNFGYGKLKQLRKPSGDRVTPPCLYAEKCGGCQLQCMRYEAQLQWKEQKVRNDLVRLGGIETPPMDPIAGMEDMLRYRNKAQFPVGTGRDGQPVAGFYAQHSHRIVPCEDCLLGAEENAAILRVVLNWMREFHIPAYEEENGTGLIRHILIRKGVATGELLVCLVINGHVEEENSRDTINILDTKSSRTQGKGKKAGMTLEKTWSDILSRRLQEAESLFAEGVHFAGVTVNENTRRTNVILGDRTVCIWGRPWLYDRLTSEKYGFSVTYQISSQSFYQVNHDQTQKIYEKVLDLADLHGEETVLDLYCGIGTISLFLARKAGKVIGVEVVPQAIEDARSNAGLNHCSNAEFYVGKAEEVVPGMLKEKGIKADVVVVDPPRKGCDPVLLETIIAIAPEKLIYVSCDPATLARDVRFLSEHGYSLTFARPYDQFGMTVHVETVVLMSRVDHS